MRYVVESIAVAWILTVPASAFEPQIAEAFVNNQKTSMFARDACPTIDFDRDGISDFAVGAAYAGPEGARRGAVVICSGKDLGVVEVFPGPVGCLGFGSSVLGYCGDLDRDGEEELLVGTLRGGWFVVAPRSGRTLRNFEGKWFRGWAEDQDGDRALELVLTSEGGDRGQMVFSGCGSREESIDLRQRQFVTYASSLLGPASTGSINYCGPLVLTLGRTSHACRIAVEVRTPPAPAFPGYVSVVADLDGDHHLDVGVSGVLTPGRHVGFVVYASSKPERLVFDEAHFYRSAELAVAIPDFDGKPGCELALGGDHGVAVLSGASMALLWHWQKFLVDPCLSLSLIRDFDGDGARDLLVGSGDANTCHGPIRHDGLLCILSGKTGTVLAQIGEQDVAPRLGR